MEKFMSRIEREKEIDRLSKLKISLYDQRDVAAKVIEFLRGLSCTADGDKMRNILIRICKQRITRINTKITEINDKIFRFNKAQEDNLL